METWWKFYHFAKGRSFCWNSICFAGAWIPPQRETTFKGKKKYFFDIFSKWGPCWNRICIPSAWVFSLRGLLCKKRICGSKILVLKSRPPVKRNRNMIFFCFSLWVTCLRSIFMGHIRIKGPFGHMWHANVQFLLGIHTAIKIAKCFTRSYSILRYYKFIHGEECKIWTNDREAILRELDLV